MQGWLPVVDTCPLSARSLASGAMTVAFAAALAVAVISLVALWFTSRRSAVTTRRERMEIQSRSRELGEARRAAEESTQKAEEANQAAAAARAAVEEREGRLADAELRLADADRRASEGEALIMRQAKRYDATAERAEARAFDLDG